MAVIVTLSGTFAYANLKLAIPDWVARGDLAEETIDTIIDLSEARINRGLRVRAMETVYFRTLDADGRAPVPQGYREFKSVYLYRGVGIDDSLPSATQSVVNEMQMTDINSLMATFGSGSVSGQRMARAGNYFYVGGKPEGAYSVGGIYYKTFPALSDANQTNWLTESAPDLMLAACMEQVNLYNKAYDQADHWGERVTKMMDDVQNEDRAERMSGGRIVTRHGVYGA